MNRLAKGLLLSLIAHIVVIGAVCLLIGTRQPEDSLVEVDLASVGFNDGKGGGGGMSGNSSGNNHVPAMAGQSDSREADASSTEQPLARPEPLDARRFDAAPSKTGNPVHTLADNLSQGAGDNPAAGSGAGSGLGGGTGLGTGSGSGTGDGSGSGTGGGGSVSHYIVANYSYILAHIQRQVVYPSQARMMGISGKAVYSFIIRQDGHIDSLSLVSSAGFDSLDAAGLKAIRKASPFPAPPAPARIKVPIVFSLR